MGGRDFASAQECLAGGERRFPAIGPRCRRMPRQRCRMRMLLQGHSGVRVRKQRSDRAQACRNNALRCRCDRRTAYSRIRDVSARVSHTPLRRSLLRCSSRCGVCRVSLLCVLCVPVVAVCATLAVRCVASPPLLRFAPPLGFALREAGQGRQEAGGGRSSVVRHRRSPTTLDRTRARTNTQRQREEHNRPATHERSACSDGRPTHGARRAHDRRCVPCSPTTPAFPPLPHLPHPPSRRYPPALLTAP